MDVELAAVLDGSLDDWMQTLPDYQQQVIRQLLSSREPMEAALAWLSSTGPANTAGFGSVRQGANLFYDSLLSQMHSLLCGTTEYVEERENVKSSARVGRDMFVASASAALAQHVGASAVLLAPAVMLTCVVLTRAGSDAACGVLAQLIEERRKSG